MKLKAADILLLFTAILGGSTFVTSKILLDSIPPFFLLAFRFGISFFVIAIVLRKQLKKATVEDLKRGCVLGTVLFLALASQTIGLQFTTASKQAFITGAYVIIAPLLNGLMSRIRVAAKDIINSCLCFVGVGLLTLTEGLHVEIGDILALISALLLALQIVLNDSFVKKTEPSLLVTFQFGVAGMEALACAVLIGPLAMNLNVSTMGAVIYLALFATCLGFYMQTVAQKTVKPERASIILSSEMFFGSIFAVVLLREQLSPLMLAGGAIILASVFINNWGGWSKKE